MVLYFHKRVSEMLRCVAVQCFKAYELLKEASEEEEGKKTPNAKQKGKLKHGSAQSNKIRISLKVCTVLQINSFYIPNPKTP